MYVQGTFKVHPTGLLVGLANHPFSSGRERADLRETPANRSFAFFAVEGFPPLVSRCLLFFASRFWCAFFALSCSAWPLRIFFRGVVARMGYVIPHRLVGVYAVPLSLVRKTPPKKGTRDILKLLSIIE
jgi:hypothetical protein